MTKDKVVPEHIKYSQRLSELEKKSAAVRKKQLKKKPRKTHIGNQIHGIKVKRYLFNSKRVLKLVFLFTAILLLTIYIISPLSKINSLTIVGNHDLSNRQVEKETKIYPGRYIWGVVFDQHQLVKQAKYNNPQIRDLTVAVTGLQSLKLTIKENALLGTAVLDNDTYAVLANGHLQQTKAMNNGIAYKRFDGHRKQLKKTAKEIGQLKPAVRNGISSVTYQPTKQYPNRLIIYMRDGNTVFADLNTVGNKLAYYPGIAASMKDKGVIDLQVGAYSYSYGSHEK